MEMETSPSRQPGGTAPLSLTFIASTATNSIGGFPELDSVRFPARRKD